MSSSSSAEPAWADPNWVLAVMHYPRDATMRESYRKIRAGQLEASVDRVILDRASDGMAESVTRGARRAITAGDVLMVLYGLDQSPWRIREPSLGKAIYVVGKFADVERHADGPSLPLGKSEIHTRIDEFRAIWHLWAAWRLLREYPTRPHRDLLTTVDGLRDFLAAAAAVQAWALRWRPKHGEKRPLLEADSYLIPADALVRLPGGRVEVRTPPWTHEPEWLKQTLEGYKPRSRE